MAWTVARSPTVVVGALVAYGLVVMLPSLVRLALGEPVLTEVGYQMVLDRNVNLLIVGIMGVTSTWIQIGLLRVLLDARRDNDPNLASLFTQFRPLLRSIGAQVVFVIGYLIGACLCGVGALFALCVLFLTVPVALFDGLGPIEAAKRSEVLMAGQKLTTFLLVLVPGLLMVGVAMVPTLAFPGDLFVFQSISVVVVIFSAMVYGLVVLAQAVLYDIRSRSVPLLDSSGNPWGQVPDDRAAT